MSLRERPLVVVAEAAGEHALATSLEPWFEVVAVSSGKDVVTRARELRPDAIVLQTELQQLDGVNTLVQLLGSPKTESIPAMVLAEPYDDADAVRCIDLGAADYLSREVSTRELVARLEKAIREARLRRELTELARTDALTGLANFRALMSRLAEEFNRADRYDYPLSVVMLDLDYLKLINDRFGHDVGNRAITTLTQTLRAGMRQTDFAARYGGDEFVVLLPHQTPAEAKVMLERVRRALSQARIEGADGQTVDVSLTMSAGIAGHTAQASVRGSEELLERADAALYEAKRGGRNRVVVCDERSAAPDTAARHI